MSFIVYNPKIFDFKVWETDFFDNYEKSFISLITKWSNVNWRILQFKFTKIMNLLKSRIFFFSSIFFEPELRALITISRCDYLTRNVKLLGSLRAMNWNVADRDFSRTLLAIFLFLFHRRRSRFVSRASELWAESLSSWVFVVALSLVISLSNVLWLRTIK